MARQKALETQMPAFRGVYSDPEAGGQINLLRTKLAEQSPEDRLQHLVDAKAGHGSNKSADNLKYWQVVYDFVRKDFSSEALKGLRPPEPPKE